MSKKKTNKTDESVELINPDAQVAQPLPESDPLETNPGYPLLIPNKDEAEKSVQPEMEYGDEYKQANNIPLDALIFRKIEHAPRYFRQHENLIFTEELDPKLFELEAPLWGQLITLPSDVEVVEQMYHLRRYLKSKGWKTIN